MMDKLIAYAQLMRFDRPIGTLLLLWPTLWGLWLSADGQPDGWIVFVFVTGVVLMRAAGCVINDYADRNFDGHVERTRERPMASGRVSEKEARVLFLILCLAAFGLVLLLNWLTIAMSVVAILLAASYPFMKRYTYLPQVHLGIAFGWAIPMAWTAHNGELPPPEAWLLLIAVVLWTVAYDTMYAMVDREDDLRIGIKSTAILFGEADKLIIGCVQATFLLVMVLVGNRLELGLFYYLGLLAALFFSIYHQYLIRNRHRPDCLYAFLNNNWLGMAVFAGILADSLLAKAS